MDITIECVMSEKVDRVINLIQMIDENIKISRWTPDGDHDEPGTYGAFIDGIDEELARTLFDLEQFVIVTKVTTD